MNTEIEVKAKIENPVEVKNNILRIAHLIKTKNQIDLYYVPRDNDYFLTFPTKEYLRVRIEKDKSSLGYHFCKYDNNNKLISTQENETIIGDPKTIILILESLGFVKKVTVTKSREVYNYKNFEICVDRIEELGDFIEVEIKKRTTSLTELEEKESCLALIKLLGAAYIIVEDGGYPDMILRIRKASN